MNTLEANIKHDGDPPFDIVVPIEHKIMSDGSHAFTSERIPGLLVMSKDKKVAIHQLPIVIRILLQENQGFDCEVTLGADDVTDTTPDFAILRKEAA